ncbi:hypothetical protein CRX72_16065 [Pantoea sp. BRM17]|nr:hypothetical protein CRX72_16065 [Pantoea sp. BRM17]
MIAKGRAPAEPGDILWNFEKFLVDKHRDRVLLVVNVASRCGLTPQYEQLESLHKAFQARGFSVLGFPCNQFLEQEPGTNEEIRTFCSTTYGVAAADLC